MFCKNCGASVSDNSHYCSSCGCRVDEDVPAQVSAPVLNERISIYDEPIKNASAPPKSADPYGYINPNVPPKSADPYGYADPNPYNRPVPPNATGVFNGNDQIVNHTPNVYTPNNTVNNANNNRPAVKENAFAWGVLGYFIPIAGLILYFIWKTEYPERSKAAGTGALISIIVNFVLGLIIGLVFIPMLISYGDWIYGDWVYAVQPILTAIM